MTIHKLSNETGNETGVKLQDGKAILYDMRAYSPRALIVIESEEMQALITLYTDGCCPVCFEEISQGDVVCNECLEAGRTNRWLFGWAR